MNKIFKTWADFVNKINSSVSERDCKKYSVLYAIVAIILAIAGVKKNRWYFIGAAIYAVISAALFKSYKYQCRERWEKVLNEPVEK